MSIEQYQSQTTLRMQSYLRPVDRQPIVFRSLKLLATNSTSWVARQMNHEASRKVFLRSCCLFGDERCWSSRARPCQLDVFLRSRVDERVHEKS